MAMPVVTEEPITLENCSTGAIGREIVIYLAQFKGRRSDYALEYRSWLVDIVECAVSSLIVV